jgi:cytohesin
MKWPRFASRHRPAVTEPPSDVQRAAEDGDLAVLRRFAEANGAAALRGPSDPGSMTLLHLAAAGGHVDIVRFLISDAVGADVTAARRNKFTPLHSAAMNGHAEICAILIEAGAQPDVQTDPQGYAPLHSAAWAGHAAAVETLLRAGADTTLLNYRDLTPAQVARRQGHPDVASQIESHTP